MIISKNNDNVLNLSSLITKEYYDNGKNDLVSILIDYINDCNRLEQLSEDTSYLENTSNISLNFNVFVINIYFNLNTNKFTTNFEKYFSYRMFSFVYKNDLKDTNLNIKQFLDDKFESKINDMLSENDKQISISDFKYGFDVIESLSNIDFFLSSPSEDYNIKSLKITKNSHLFLEKVLCFLKKDDYFKYLNYKTIIANLNESDFYQFIKNLDLNSKSLEKLVYFLMRNFDDVFENYKFYFDIIYDKINLFVNNSNDIIINIDNNKNNLIYLNRIFSNISLLSIPIEINSSNLFRGTSGSNTVDIMNIKSHSYYYNDDFKNILFSDTFILLNAYKNNTTIYASNKIKESLKRMLFDLNNLSEDFIMKLVPGINKEIVNNLISNFDKINFKYSNTENFKLAIDINHNRFMFIIV